MVPAVPMREPIHLRPAAELAERVLLPGDPHRSLTVAQALLEGPLMFNHRRGLWGYTGGAPDGLPITVQSTGMGGPSAAIVVEELIDLGARTLLRLGTCGALVPELELGELLVATDVIAADGASSALGAPGRVMPDRRLTGALAAAAQQHGGGEGTVVSTDLFYDDRAEVTEEWIAQGAVAVEMEAAAVLRVAERRGVAAACLLAVTDLLAEGPERRVRVDREGLESAGIRLGEVAIEAFAALSAKDRAHPAA
jgi:DeoD family purine-nucleoside phosphorylase